MTIAGRFGLIGGTALCLALACVGMAWAEENCKKDVDRLADLFEKKDLEGAKKLGEELGKKYELDAFMVLFQQRKNDGFGVGDKPNVIKPDGIENKLLDMSKKEMSAKDLDAQNAALLRMCYQTAALAEMTLHRCPVDKKQGTRDPVEWKKWTEDMRKCSLELADAVAAKNPKDTRTAAGKLCRSCQKCHDSFRN